MTKPQNTCITFAPPSPDNPHSASFPITTHSRADSLSQHLFALFFLFNVGKMEVVEWIERERAKAKKKKKGKSKHCNSSNYNVESRCSWTQIKVRKQTSMVAVLGTLIIPTGGRGACGGSFCLWGFCVLCCIWDSVSLRALAALELTM